MDLRLAQILVKNRLQPHSTTGVTPAELLIGRKPRTHLDLLHPDRSKRVEEKHSSQKQCHDSRRIREREFKLGDSVYATNFQTGDSWLQGKISKDLGTRNYLKIGKVVKRHVNQLKYRFVEDFTPVEDVVPVTCPSVSSPAPDAPDDNIVELELRRSARDRHPPDRYTG